MTKFPPAINKFLWQVEKQTGLEIGEEETGEDMDVPLEAVIEAMTKGGLFYCQKKKGFYMQQRFELQQKYEEPKFPAVKVSWKDALYFVADELEDYYGDTLPVIGEEKEEKEEIEEGIRGEVKPEIPAEGTAVAEATAVSPEEKAGEPAAQEKVREETREEAEPKEPLEEFPAPDTDPHFRLPEGFVREPEQDGTIFGEFETPPPGAQPGEATIIALPPPPPAEKERRGIERKKRWEAKRGKLALDLQNDDLSVGKKSLANYLTYLEEAPKLSLPGKGDEPARREYVDNLFHGAVRVKGRKVVLDYLDTLEKVMAGAGGEAASNFAGLAPVLYHQLPSEKVNEYVARGMKVTNPVERLAYFRRESREAQDILAALADEELIKVNERCALLEEKLKETKEKYARQTAELEKERRKVEEKEAQVAEKEGTIADLTIEAAKWEKQWEKGTERLRRRMRWKTLGAAVLAFLAGAGVAYAYLEDKINHSGASGNFSGTGNYTR